MNFDEREDALDALTDNVMHNNMGKTITMPLKEIQNVINKYKKDIQAILKKNPMKVDLDKQKVIANYGNYIAQFEKEKSTALTDPDAKVKQTWSLTIQAQDKKRYESYNKFVVGFYNTQIELYSAELKKVQGKGKKKIYKLIR
jgi:hypothetical protein